VLPGWLRDTQSYTHRANRSNLLHLEKERTVKMMVQVSLDCDQRNQAVFA
jgi:hypothetical protein